MARDASKKDTDRKGKASGRSGARSDDASKGKRTSVKRISAMLSAPAQIMGPRLLFIISVVLLAAMGLVMVYSSSSIMALSSADYGNDPAYFLKRQGLFLALGVVACIAVAAIPYRFWAKKPVFIALWLLTVGVLFLTAAGMGVSALGAERSIVIGPFALQPSEFAKVSILLTVASFVEMHRQEELPPHVFYIVLAVSVLVPLILIYRQPDLGTAIILLVGLMALAVLLGVPWVFILGFVVVCVLYVIYVCISQPYHLDRIYSMFDPWTDPEGKGYQSIQSLYALGSGGLFGTGLGLSRQKYLYLPYAHTDFIFAIIGEELGLVGTAAVVALFACLVFGGMRIARNAPDIYGMSIAGALTTMLGFQACVNMACVIGIAPVTGKALPFISYGGSSIIATMIICGFVLSVSLRSSVDAVYEQRRDDLFVIPGRRDRSKDKSDERASDRGAGRVPSPAAAGLRVIEGFKNRVGNAAEATREQTGRGRGSSRPERGDREESAARASSRASSRSSRSSSSRGYGRTSSSYERSSSSASESTRSSRRSGTSSSRSRSGSSYASDSRSTERSSRTSRSTGSSSRSQSSTSSTRKKGYGRSFDNTPSSSSSRRRSSASELSTHDSEPEYKGRIKYPTRSRTQSSSQRRRHNRPGTRH